MTPTYVLDIGANKGEWTRQASHIWKSANFYMIEACEVHSNHLKVVGFPYDIRILSDSCKSVEFYTNKTDLASTGNSLYREDTHYFSDDNILIETKEARSLDSLNLGRFDMIKLDTQGSEIDILKGASETLLGVKHILMEVSLTQYNIGSPRFYDVIEFINSIGFEVLDIIDNHYLNNELIQVDVLFKRK